MIQVIHTADIHFGMENYGSIDPKTGIHSRLLDFERALNFCIDHAIEIKTDLFVFSGDAYKTTHPSPTQQKLFLRCLLRLYKAGIPVVIIVGNHDNPVSFGKANSLEIFGDMPLEGFYVIDRPRTLLLQTKNGPVQLVGIPWPTRTTLALNAKNVGGSAHEITEFISNAVAQYIQEAAHQLDPTIPSILAGHLTVSSGIFSGSEKRAIYGNDPLFMPSQLAIEPFDYVALGHLHRYQNLNPHGYPALVYAGSIERIDFGERKEEKGFCVVDLVRRATTHTFVQTPTRPFVQIELELGENAAYHTQEILVAIDKHTIKDAVVKILYHVPPGVKDSVDIGAVERRCSTAKYLVGIIPIRAYSSRERRIVGSAEMDVETLLSSYFDQKTDTQQSHSDAMDPT